MRLRRHVPLGSSADRRSSGLWLFDEKNRGREECRSARRFLLRVGVLATMCLAAAILRPISAAAQAEADFQNVWVHYDYMVFPPGWTSAAGNTFPNGLSMAPPQAAIDQVVEAFRAQGLTLHIDPIHNAIPGHQVLIPDFDYWWTNPTETCTGPDAVSFMALRNQYFQPHDIHPWHYAIFGFDAGLPDTSFDGSACPHAPSDPPAVFISPSGSGYSELPGFNFIVALGGLIDEGVVSEIGVNTFGGVFMHELGHNFGLEHGGVFPDAFERLNAFKPNYISVMSYWDDLNGIFVAAQPGSATPAPCNADPDCPADSHCSGNAGGNFCYRLDYSNQALLTLTETDLDETVGVGGPPEDTDIVQYCGPLGLLGEQCALQGPSVGPIDWNNDGVIETDVAVDIDAVNVPVAPNATPIRGFDDWAYVKQQLQIPPEVIESGPKRAVYESAPRRGPLLRH